MKFIDEKIEKYAVSKSVTPSSICDELADYTIKNEKIPQMLIGKMEGSFLGFLIQSLRVKKILEVGTFTGYSALAMAEQLPEDGILHTIDIEKRAITQDFWNRSKHGKKIVFHHGRALEVMSDLKLNFDLIFIDADKINYLNYLKRGLQCLSENGIIVIDNCLWGGEVLKSKDDLAGDKSSLAIKELNDWVALQNDLYGTLLPVRDGMFLISKVN